MTAQNSDLPIRDPPLRDRPVRWGRAFIFLLGFLSAVAVALAFHFRAPTPDTTGATPKRRQLAREERAQRRDQPPGELQPVGAGTGNWILASGTDSEGRETVWLFNATEQKLAAYRWDQDFLYLLAQRNVRYDFEIADFNNRRRERLSSDRLKVLIEKIKEQRKKRK